MPLYVCVRVCASLSLPLYLPPAALMSLQVLHVSPSPTQISTNTHALIEEPPPNAICFIPIHFVSFRSDPSKRNHFSIFG